jgi:protein-S-isoprenylcysteine O-methyltransferase Ste14
MMHNGPDRLGNRGTWWVVGQIILLAAIVLVPRQINEFPAVPDSLASVDILVGIIIAGLGGIFGLLGVFSLGPNLTIFPRPLNDSTLIETGIYGLVRHPIYTGVILMALGWSIARSSIFSLLLTLVLAVFFDLKARREEGWLEQKFPEYATYRKRVHKLIPWLY